MKNWMLSRRIRLVTLLICVALLLSGCSKFYSSEEGEASLALPEPPAAQSLYVFGSGEAYSSIDVNLHCMTAGSLEMTPIKRSIQYQGKPLDAVVRELLNANTQNGALPIALGEHLLEGVECSGGVVSVRLRSDALHEMSDRDYLLLSTSISNTLLEISGIRAVNLLCADSARAVCGLPMGVSTLRDINVAASYARIQAEESYADKLSRTAQLYFPDRSGSYVLPEVREISFFSETLLSELLDALRVGPIEHLACVPAVPQSLDLLESAPEIRVTDAGLRVCEIALSPTFSSYLALSATPPWQAYASIVLTLTSFVPGIDAVRFSIEGVYVTECSANGIAIPFADGLMRRSDFSPFIGDSRGLYFEGEDTKLARMECAMTQACASSPYALLSCLMDAQGSDAESLKSVFPSGTSSADLLGLQLDGHNAIVNLSAQFYARSQSLSSDEERQLIYAMVNTLCELTQIKTVSFLVEGAPISSLAQASYLRVPLLPDFGMSGA